MDKNSKLYKILLEIWEKRGLDITQIVDVYGLSGWDTGRRYSARIKNPKPKPTGFFKSLWVEHIEYGDWIYQYEVIEYFINNKLI